MNITENPFVPFYNEDGITIYNADCRKVLPWLDQFDLLLTDPPYGIGCDGHKPDYSQRKHGARKAFDFAGWDKEIPLNIPDCLRAAKDQVIWGGNYFTEFLPGTRGWLVWDKGQSGLSQSDCELAFTSQQFSLRRLVLNRCALLKDSTTHPTQKPVALMRWCLSFFPDAETILDPFMGSGTTLLAAKLEGRKAVGIEINQKYCEDAVERLRQKVLF